VPLFDTTALHALAAVDFALAPDPQAAPTWRRTAAASCAELTGLVM